MAGGGGGNRQAGRTSGGNSSRRRHSRHCSYHIRKWKKSSYARAHRLGSETSCRTEEEEAAPQPCTPRTCYPPRKAWAYASPAHTTHGPCAWRNGGAAGKQHCGRGARPARLRRTSLLTPSARARACLNQYKLPRSCAPARKARARCYQPRLGIAAAFENGSNAQYTKACLATPQQHRRAHKTRVLAL